MTEKGKKKGGKEAYVMTLEAGNHWNRRRASNEAGQVLLIMALAIVVLIGSLALAGDVGYWRYVRRNMQKAADAGAIAGATETIHSGLIDFAAKADTAKNGFEDGKKGVIVGVYNPPISGPLSLPHGDPYRDRPDSTHYVEVRISQIQPTFFSKIFNFTPPMVSVRAVAYAGLTNGDSCVYVLNPDDNRALNVVGASNVHADCDICVASKDPGALTVGGGSPTNPSEVIAEGVSIAGGYVLNGANAKLEPLPGDEAYGARCSNPLVGIKPPEGWQAMPCEKTNYIAHDNTTLHPGRYCGGIKVLAGVKVPFEDGLYIIDGGDGFNAAANGTTLIGKNVTFYNTGGGPYGDGKITINGNSATDLEAGATGYEGILFFQDPQNTQPAKFNGNSQTIMLGALYFPTALAEFEGQNDTTVGYTMIVADTLKFDGGATFHIENDNGGPSSTPPVTKVVLVE
jgi:hypothetical protein